MDLLNTADVARMLSVPEATARYWRSISYGPRSFKMGPKAVRYRRADVEAFISQQESADSVAGVA